MELLIKNKWISFGGSSFVTDVEGKPIYNIKGKVFTFTRKKFIQDLEGNTKYVVRNKFWRLFAYRAFVLDNNNNVVANIRRKIFSMHDRYFVESSFGNLELKGNILGFDYHIYLNGEEIGHVARKISFRDSFVLTTEKDDIDPMFLVSLVIAIDNITDQRRDNQNASYDSNY